MRRLAEVTDLSEGRLSNMIDLQPSAGLKHQRVRHTGQDDQQVEMVQSTASTIRAKTVNQQKQVENNFSTTPQDRMNIDPMQAHNFAKTGLSFYTIEALQRFADMRLPNHAQFKGKGKGSSSYYMYYDATGKLAFLWVPGQAEIDLLPECLLCFRDYTIDEIAVLIKAVKSNQYEFSLLQYDGTSISYCSQRCMQSWASWPLREKELPKSRNANEREYPKMTLGRELALPPGVESLGRRQLNELLANMPYHQQRSEYFMDKRIGMSTTARERFATSAPAQDRRPPAPPSAPPTRRGRSSDERANVSLLPTATGHAPRSNQHQDEWSRLRRG